MRAFPKARAATLRSGSLPPLKRKRSSARSRRGTVCTSSTTIFSPKPSFCQRISFCRAASPIRASASALWARTENADFWRSCTHGRAASTPCRASARTARANRTVQPISPKSTRISSQARGSTSRCSIRTARSPSGWTANSLRATALPLRGTIRECSLPLEAKLPPRWKRGATAANTRTLR